MRRALSPGELARREQLGHGERPDEAGRSGRGKGNRGEAERAGLTGVDTAVGTDHRALHDGTGDRGVDVLTGEQSALKLSLLDLDPVAGGSAVRRQLGREVAGGEDEHAADVRIPRSIR